MALRFDHVTLFCFFASYLLALLLELSQFLRSIRFNRWVALAATGAGLIAHTIYLFVRSRSSGLPPLVGSMHDWLLVLAWLAAAWYLVALIRDQRLALGVFLLPLVLVLVGSAHYVGAELRHRTATYVLGMWHASFLVLGIAGVAVSFILSLMYLVQHRRLKHRAPESAAMQIFSLERLSHWNWWAVVGSAPLLTLGFATGAWLTWKSQSTQQPIALATPAFIICGLLWLGLIGLFAWLLKTNKAPGKLVAWRTLWACGFLLFVIVGLELASGGIHGRVPQESITPQAPPTPGLSSSWFGPSGGLA